MNNFQVFISPANFANYKSIYRIKLNARTRFVCSQDKFILSNKIHSSKIFKYFCTDNRGEMLRKLFPEAIVNRKFH